MKIMSHVGMIAAFCLVPLWPVLAGAVVVWEDWTAGNEIHSVREEKGQLLVGTAGGLVVWDVRERSYAKYDERDGLADNWVRCAAAGPEGVIWVGTMHGLSRLRNGSVDETQIEGMASMVSDLEVGQDGTVWIGTDFEGIYWYDGQTIGQTRFGSGGRCWITSLAIDRDGCVWVTTWGQGLKRYSAGLWQTFTPPSASAYLNDVEVDPDGGVWVLESCEPEDLLHHYGAGQWQTYALRPGEWPLLEMSIDGSGIIWLLCGDGLVRFDGQNAELFSAIGGCSLAMVCSSIAPGVDEEGIWVGLANDGLLRIQDMQPQAWVTEDPITRSYGNALAMEQDKLWVGMDRTHLASYSEGQWEMAELVPGASVESDVKSISVGPDGTKWACSEEDGLLAYDGRDTVVYNWMNSPLCYYYGPVFVGADGAVWVDGYVPGLHRFGEDGWELFEYGVDFPLTSVSAIRQSTDGFLWFGGVAGACSFDGESWTHYTVGNSGLPDDAVQALACSSDGRVWFGTSGGLAVLDGSIWTTYDAANSGLPSNSVTALAASDNDTVWTGTAGNGLASFDGSQWIGYRPDNSPVIDLSVHEIVNGNDAVWISTAGGLCCRREVVGSVELSLSASSERGASEGEEPPWSQCLSVRATCVNEVGDVWGDVYLWVECPDSSYYFLPSLSQEPSRLARKLHFAEDLNVQDVPVFSRDADCVPAGRYVFKLVIMNRNSTTEPLSNIASCEWTFNK